MKNLKLISWNVNGIRSVYKMGFLDFVKKYNPDILCLQETKAPHPPYSIELPGYAQYWSHGVKPGYSGTAIFTKIKPLSVSEGMGIKEHDREGRILNLEFKNFYLVNVYVPNSQRTLARLPYRQNWDKDFLKYLKRLEKKKPVIFCGDLNVAHREIDLSNPKANIKNHGFTPEERAGFQTVLDSGFLDTFRVLYPEKTGCYTWWSRFANCRARNIGWRIDYFVISKSLKPHLKKVEILKDVLGSDHCPVAISLTSS